MTGRAYRQSATIAAGATGSYDEYEKNREAHNGVMRMHRDAAYDIEPTGIKADLLEAAYEIYAEGHPWVTEYPLRPKSVARELSELAMTFVEFVGHYRLAASEGLVLRYLADSYKALKRTVPDDARTEELADLTEWLGELVRQVDSSLLDEWEQLTSPDQVPEGLAKSDWASANASIKGAKRAVRSRMRLARAFASVSCDQIRGLPYDTGFASI